MPSNADLITSIMLAVFRTNGSLLSCGDQLVSRVGLTSARWQILGAIALPGKPQTVPQIAETMGITRQGALKQANRLVEEGLLELLPNPRHERSPLYALSSDGAAAYESASQLNSAWTAKLARGMSHDDLDTTLRVLHALNDMLADKLPPEART